MRKTIPIYIQVAKIQGQSPERQKCQAACLQHGYKINEESVQSA